MSPIVIEIEDLRDALAAIKDNGERQQGESDRLARRLARLLKLREELWPGRYLEKES